MLTCENHQSHHNISFENSHFTARKLAVYCIHVGAFRPLSLTSYTSMALIKTVSVSFSFEILFLVYEYDTDNNVTVHAVSLLISRPATEEMCSN